MKKTRGPLLLASVASLAATSGTQAADLPVKAKPVEYVKICTLYGAGFYDIPGTDTCIRIGGHIRAEVSFLGRGGGDRNWFVGDGTTTRTRDQDIFFTRSRSYLNVDTRTQTSFGSLRTYSVVRAEHATATGLAGATTAINVDTAFIQWGGFTIGRTTASFFDGPWDFAFKWGSNGSFGWPDSTSGRFVAAYTHQFGNGVTGAISLEDNKHQKRGNYNGANALSIIGVNGPTVDTRGGNTWPEIVAQFRIDKGPAWGLHISANLMNNHVAYNCGGTSGTTTVAAGGCSELAGNPSDKVGGGVHAVLAIQTPTGVNDGFYIGGTWSRGATADAIRNNGVGSGLGIYGGSDGLLSYGSITGTYIWDSVYSSTTRTGAGITVGPVGQQLTDAYGASLAFEHGWNTEWRTSVFGGAQFVNYNSTANAILCSRFAAGSATGTLVNAAVVNVSNTDGCNFDYRIAGAGTRTFWTPVKDLTIGVEFQWSNHHVSHADGTFYLQPTISGFKPNATYQIRDQNVFSGIFSVRRFF